MNLDFFRLYFSELLPYSERSDWSLFSYQTRFYTPRLPLDFIIFYSSILLSLKRTRALEYSGKRGIIFGLLIFLFFSSILNIPQVRDIRYSDLGSVVFIAGCIFFVLGLVIIIYLYKAEATKDKVLLINHTSDARLLINDFDYIAYTGVLFLKALGIAIAYVGLIFLVAKFSRYNSGAINIISLMALIGFLILSVGHIGVSMYRLRDIGFKAKWIPLGLVAYLLISAGAMILNHWSNITPLKYAFNYLVFFAINFMTAVQFFLFILPSKKQIASTD